MWKPCKSIINTFIKAKNYMDKILICCRINVGKFLFFHVNNKQRLVKGGEVVNKNVIFHKIYTIFTHIYPHTLPRNNLFN